MISASSGVVSNIDYSTLISQLVGIKRESITQLETEKTTLKSAKSAYSTLSTKVKELITASDALKTGSAFSVFKTNTSDNPYFKASANATAAAGSYEITVNTLAKAHRMAPREPGGMEKAPKTKRASSSPLPWRRRRAAPSQWTG